ncbi:MAG: nucleotide exchange factor GrpE [Nitrospinales bacterium]
MKFKKNKQTKTADFPAEDDGGNSEADRSFEENGSGEDTGVSKAAPTLEEQLRQKEEETSRLQERFLRLQAETDNFKKRLLREKSDFAQFANERLIKELIPIHENLERALAAPDTNARSLKEGVEMIFKQFTALLEKEKVEPIPTVGKKFDPAVHEALSQVESDEHEENTVVQEFSKGFFMNGRVLRPAKVVISKKPAKSKPGHHAKGGKKHKQTTGSA